MSLGLIQENYRQPSYIYKFFKKIEKWGTLLGQMINSLRRPKEEREEAGKKEIRWENEVLNDCSFVVETVAWLFYPHFI